MDVTSLKAVLAELRPWLLPSRFEKAQQGSPQALQLGLRSLDGVHWLELSWMAEAPRLHAIAPPPRQGDGSTLARQLQHGLRGLALVDLVQSGWERVVELGFARRPSDPVERWLVLELMGRHSNLFLLDEARQVVALARQVRQQHSRLRPIATGDPYQCPPPLQGEAPSRDASLAQWRGRLQLQDLSLREALLRSYQGVSPALVTQLVEPELVEAPVASLTADQWQRLHGRWSAWLGALQHQHFAFARTDDGYACWNADACWIDAQASAENAGCSVNMGLATYYGDRLQRRQHLRLQQQWQQRLALLRHKEQQQLEVQQGLLLSSEQADALQRQADALLCEAHRDPLAATEAQKLYRRAKRLRRSVAAVQARIDLHQQRLAWLEASLTYLDQADSEAVLTPLVLDLAAALDAGVAGDGRRRGQRRGASQPEGVPQPLELCSPGGLRLQVGRNHRQNAWISLRQARRGDLWFHAQECPGSHVVLKASEGPWGDADLAAAADLAAYFSRARGNGRVAVVMVPTDDLQRIPGAAPGTVRHRGGTVLWAVPAQAAALLASPPTLPVEASP
ncbi:MAG: NFACT family protein [Cyanobacteria bacterium REEB417]|nr:NFACT family protein [Cyanobacteria bacterium REEB417]